MSNNNARKQALKAHDAYQPKPTSLITYRSSGRVIAIGDDDALDRCRELPQGLNINLVSSTDASDGIQISGYLGDYVVSVSDQHGNATTHKADAVLDLHERPILAREMLPPGYFHVPPMDWGKQDLVEELENLTGEFEKPKYFDYDESICAHGVNGKIACRLCIDACPAEAIQSLVERIEVNPYLCQGGGTCATVCPSGAIRYLYPNLRDNGNRLRDMLRVYREHGGQQAVGLFYGQAYSPEHQLQAHDNLLPFPVEEMASAGMDMCLSALTYGAKQVILCVDDQVLAGSLEKLNAQLEWVQAILMGLGLEPACITTWSVDDALAFVDTGCNLEAAINDMPESKRSAIFQALDHLVTRLQPAHEIVELPDSAPLGEVVIDAEKCTLCMACVGVCPGKALQDGSNREKPEVFFIESLCLQCNGCVITCPEQAMTLVPRIVFDREVRNRARELNSDTPFACITCGKPFAPTSVIHKMQEKLKDHYMFDSERALNRLKMCEDCRVVDIAQDPEAMGGQFDPLKGFRD